MKALQARMTPSGIETICVSAKAMHFAVTSPNHKANKELTCEQSRTLFSFASFSRLVVLNVGHLGLDLRGGAASRHRFLIALSGLISAVHHKSPVIGPDSSPVSL